MEPDESQKKRVIDEARTSGATVHFASLMDICHLKNAELEAKHQKYRGRVVLRGDLLIPKCKWKMLTHCKKIQNRNVQTFGFVYYDTKGQNHGPAWKIQSFLLKGICTAILWQDCYGKGNLRKSYCNMAGRKFQIVNVSFYIVEKDYSYLCMWMTSKIGLKETKS